MVGDRIAGRYEVLRFIASGGMGEVYAARDHTLDTDVALKTLKPELQSSTLALERFRREIALARGVTDPHVCRVYDVGEHEGRVFFTMELLEGASLRERDLPLPLDAIEHFAPQLVAGLAALHAKGIVHRDFKPANVIVAGDRAVITDFGLARSLDDSGDAKLTLDSGLLGTPAYMSPEQVEGRPATPASDIYALGVVLFELLTGRLPFLEDTAMAAATARLHREAPRPSSVRSEVPARWDAIVARCLARDPAARFLRVQDVLAPPSRSRRWFLVAGGVGVAAAAVGTWRIVAHGSSSGARRLDATQAIAVMPVADNLAQVPKHLAFTIDVHDFLASAAIPIIDIHSPAMDTSVYGPAIRWSREPDPIAAAFAFSHIPIVVLHAMVDDAAVLTFVTRDGNRRERRITARDGSTLAIDAAAAIARAVGAAEPRIQDPVLTPAQYRAYGEAWSWVHRKLSDADRAIVKERQYRRLQFLIDLSDAVPGHARLAAHVADRIQAVGEQKETLEETTTILEFSRSFLDRAFAADANCALAHAIQGHDAMLAWDWKRCDAATRRGHELAPTHGRTRYHRSHFLLLDGRFDELLPFVEHDRVLMPHERLGDAPLGYFYYYARRYEDAIRVIEPKLKAFALDNWLEAVWASMLVMSYAALARVDEAAATASYLNAGKIDNYSRTILVGAYAAAGRLDDAKRLYQELRNVPGLPLGQIALMADSVGDYETALNAIEKTVESRNGHALFLKIDPFSAPLRAQPRFTALMKKLGFLS